MTVQAFDHAVLAKAIFEESNRVRLAHGVRALAPIAALDAAADEQAAYLALALRSGHDNPLQHERNVAERAESAGLYDSPFAGANPARARLAENAIMMPARRPPGSSESGYTYRTYAAFLVEGWMNSPDHRASLLNPGFAYLGCAARLGRGFAAGDYRVFATQVFFQPLSGP